MDRITTKTKWKIYTFFTLYFKFWRYFQKVLKICKIEPSHLLFLLFSLAFASAGIIFQKYLELHSTISEKKYFRHKFSFLTDFPRPPVKRDKVFCWCMLSNLNLPGWFFFGIAHLTTWSYESFLSILNKIWQTRNTLFKPHNPTAYNFSGIHSFCDESFLEPRLIKMP